MDQGSSENAKPTLIPKQRQKQTKHVLFKPQMTKDLEKIRKQQRCQDILPIREKRIRIILDSLSETMKKEYSEVFRLMRENHQVRILHPAKLSFKCKGELKTFLDEEQLKKLIAGKSFLQEMLKEFIREKESDPGHKFGFA